MYSIIYNPEVKRFSISTRLFGSNNKKKDWYFTISNDDFNRIRNDQKWQSTKGDKNKQKQYLDSNNISYTDKSNNSNNGSGSGGDKGGNNRESSNHWTKNSPKIYAFKKLLVKNLEELERDRRVISYKEIDDNYAVELPGDIWLQIYTTADGTYIITKLEMDSGGYMTSSRRFNAIVAGPKDLRNIITNAKSLENPGFLRSLILRGVGRLTGTDIVDKINFKLW